jgi:hypothetical protein
VHKNPALVGPAIALFHLDLHLICLLYLLALFARSLYFLFSHSANHKVDATTRPLVWVLITLISSVLSEFAVKMRKIFLCTQLRARSSISTTSGAFARLLFDSADIISSPALAQLPAQLAIQPRLLLLCQQRLLSAVF